MSDFFRKTEKAADPESGISRTGSSLEEKEKTGVSLALTQIDAAPQGSGEASATATGAEK
jgi:hypothetical protein